MIFTRESCLREYECECECECESGGVLACQFHWKTVYRHIESQREHSLTHSGWLRFCNRISSMRCFSLFLRLCLAHS